MQKFDLSLIKGIKAKPRGSYNRRFTEAEVARIRACWEQNGRRYGLGRAIANKIGITPGALYWITSGRAYK